MSNTESAKQKSVVVHHQLREVKHRPGFSTVSARCSTELDLDPVLNIDLFHMSQPTFAPHPHAGFSAVTYMLPESTGVFTNRDSLGDHSRIGPGALHWTQAGAGVVHEELPATVGEDCWGFQIFVDLAAANKQLPPRVFHADAGQIPEVVGTGSKVRVLVGALDQARSPVAEVGQLATAVDMFDVTLEPGAELELPLADGQRAWVLAISGSGLVGEQPIDGHEIVVLSEAGVGVTLRGHDTTLRALVCAATPLRQPVIWGGPFAMTNEADLKAARARYEAGEMGTLSPAALA
ncbi:pirin family protein [Enhygromyxa salina]|uniref:Pirin n=1 Tax=Enhygromyxa salina TaxID=215803 RepID=A0A2S9YNE0_9BACT|nr:pirin-like C-terminal cupin domain-containing protein [Enhygromyxa salina]PRQ06613.1 Pirin [Enhygromyxa salina]